MTREWTDHDVDRWIGLIKREDPQLWDRYIAGEKATRSVDIEDSDAMRRLARRHLFPDATPGSLGTLTGLLRDKIWAELNLKWP